MGILGYIQRIIKSNSDFQRIIKGSDSSFKFYQNKGCRYFPCHVTEGEMDVEDFNCKFCLCPMYFTDCDGDYEILDNGVKDCSGCLYPHRKDSYDVLMKDISSRIEKTKKGFGGEINDVD